ncbi:MAG: DUF4974 domain-containing protein [Marinifilaceae bacterium]|nr:DUF4974 domain-containing protein [Marinifilaceae bacterium]
MERPNNINIDILYRKMAGLKLSPAEEEEFNCWYRESSRHREFYELLCHQQEKIETGERSIIDVEKGWSILMGKRQKCRRLRIRLWQNIAAIILLTIGLGSFWIWNNQTAETSTETAHNITTNSGVTLRLGSGRQIRLDSLAKQEVVPIDSSQIQMKRGVLHYNNNPADSNVTIYNELNVPRTGEFIMVLSDGTKVFLNSDSKLRYPTTFSGQERRVQLTGEAYFIVSKDKKPFIVETAWEEIKVFGTEFNVMAYNKEDVSQTTLVKGSVGVRVKKAPQKDFQKIKPGEQFRFNNQNHKTEIVQVDVFPYIAWKDGLFVSQNDNLETIMKKIERWFGVIVFYQNEGLKEKRFYGIMKKQNRLEDVLEIISEAGDVHFSVKDKTVIVQEK